MSKFILCTNKNDYTNLESNFEDFYEKSSDTNGVFGWLCTYKKLRIATKNFYRNGTDFAAGVGTFFYNEKNDAAALEDILNAFNNDVNELRKKIVGSYCIIIYKNKQLHIFVDAAGTYNVYYHLDEERKNIVITTTYYHVAKVCENIEIDKQMFISEWLHSILLEPTMFKNVKKLMGDKALTFTENFWEIQSIGYSMRDFSENMVESIKCMYYPLTKFNKSSIFLTGGQDSRLSLALLLSLKIKPLICYGRGNSSDTSTKQKDLDIVNEIARKYNLPIHYMNWNDSDQKNMNSYLSKYGELFTLYCMNKNFFCEFEERISTEFICFGYFGEVFRTVELIESYNKEVFTLREYIDEIYLAEDVKIFNNEQYKIYSERIYELLLEICIQKQMKPEALTKKDFQKLNTVYRQRWDTQLNNFANLFFYSCPLFGDKEITDIAEEEEYKYRLNSKYQMQLISKLESTILEVPFFSHIKVKEFNPDTYELIDKNMVSKNKDRIREIIKNPKIIYFLKNIYYVLQRDPKGLQEIRSEHQEKMHLKKLLTDNRICEDVINLKYAIDMMDARRIKNLLLLKYLSDKVLNETDKKTPTN